MHVRDSVGGGVYAYDNDKIENPILRDQGLNPKSLALQPTALPKGYEA